MSGADAARQAPASSDSLPPEAGRAPSSGGNLPSMAGRTPSPGSHPFSEAGRASSPGGPLPPVTGRVPPPDDLLPSEARQARRDAQGWHNVQGATTDELEQAEALAQLLYADIIDLPAHVSTRHPRQPRDVRAAQFAPFDALTGFGDAIDDTAQAVLDMVDLQDQGATDESLSGFISMRA